MSQTATEPDYRIHRILPQAGMSAVQLTENTKIKHVVLCVRQGAYLVAPEGFNPIKLGFGYPSE